MKRVFLVFLIICLSFTSISVCAENIPLTARSAVLVESETGRVLFEKNPHEKLAPASVTKVMTMLLTMEALSEGRVTYDDMITVSERAMSMGGSSMYLATGEQFSVRDILKGIAVASGNDAAVAMAEHLEGSVEAFSDKMNQKAKELGMENSNFINPNGLDADGHYTSAYDISLMSRELIKYPDIFDFVTIWMETMRDGKLLLANTNKMLKTYSGLRGLKTGFTNNARSCMSAYAERDNMGLIAVVMGAPSSSDRFSDAEKLLDMGFANYAIFDKQKAGEIMGEVRVNKGVSESVRAVLKDDISVLVKKGDKAKVIKNVVLEEEVSAPIDENTNLGRVEYILGDEVIESHDIVPEQAVKKGGFKIIFVKLLRSVFGGNI